MQRVGPYELGEQLGAGGMGVVYRARRDDGTSDVALKVIADGDASSEARARFAREARIAAALDHPGIVRVLESGEDGDVSWFAMELVDGPSLRAEIAAGDVGRRQAVEIIHAAAEALAAAHARGVLHRDLKPSNILLDAQDTPHIVDFGLAKDTRTGSKYTRTGQTLGTPAYMSPEQARGELSELTPASDVWSLGCVLFELAAGQPAYSGDTPAGVIGHVLTGERAPLPPGTRAMDRELERLLAGCLARVPAHRYRDGQELADACRALLDGTRTPRPAGRPRSRRGLATSAALAVLLVTGTGVWWAQRSPPAPPGPPAIDPSVVSAAERAWDMRRTDPAAGAAALAHQLELAPARDDWRVRLGVLHWAAGDVAAARAVWRGLPESSREWSRARWYLGFETLSRTPGAVSGDSLREARRELELACTRPGPHARLARAGLALLDRDFDATVAALRDAPGWEAALLRALADQWPGRNPTGALRDYEIAREQGLRFEWLDYNRAVLLRDLGRSAAALEIFDRLVADNPDEPDLRRSRAEARLNAGDVAGTLADLDRAVTIRPDDFRTRRHRARIRLRQDRRDEWQSILDAAVRAAPEDPAPRADRAAWYWESAELANALTDLDVALSARPTDHTLRTWRAEVRSASRDWQGATEDATMVLTAEPDNHEIRLFLARLLERRGRQLESLAEYDTLLEYQPEAHKARLERAVVALGLSRTREAMDGLARIPPSSPEYAFARSTIGLTHYQAGEFDAAAREYEEALAADPQCAPALHNRGLLRRRRGDTAGALEDQSAALAVQPSLLVARRERAKLLALRGDLAGALKDYGALIAAHPRNGNLRFDRGLVFERLRRWDDALADYAAAVELNPSAADAWTNIGVVRVRKAQMPQALAAFTKAVELDPSLAVAWHSRGVVRSESDDPEGAIADFREAIRLDPELVDAYGALGTLLAKSGEWSAAIAPLTRALVLDANGPRAETTRRLLAECRAKVAAGR